MINWKLRLKNRATLVALIGVIVSAVYNVAGLLGYVPPVSEDTTVQAVGLIINILVGLGVVVDPTTAGIQDSPQAMQYTEPREVN